MLFPNCDLGLCGCQRHWFCVWNHRAELWFLCSGNEIFLTTINGILEREREREEREIAAFIFLRTAKLYKVDPVIGEKMEVC